ncbi:MAG: hypothetical protein RR485_04915 [Mucinivorans sp.]
MTNKLPCRGTDRGRTAGAQRLLITVTNKSPCRGTDRGVGARSPK